MQAIRSATELFAGISSTVTIHLLLEKLSGSNCHHTIYRHLYYRLYYRYCCTIDLSKRKKNAYWIWVSRPSHSSNFETRDYNSTTPVFSMSASQAAPIIWAPIESGTATLDHEDGDIMNMTMKIEGLLYPFNGSLLLCFRSASDLFRIYNGRRRSMAIFCDLLTTQEKGMSPLATDVSANRHRFQL